MWLELGTNAAFKSVDKRDKWQTQNSRLTYIFLKVLQAEVVGFEEELILVHVAGVQNDVGALRHPVTLNDVIRQGSTHGEVHHWVEAQALVDEGLQHLQLLKVPLLERLLT